jgi:hypothetical protein
MEARRPSPVRHDGQATGIVEGFFVAGKPLVSKPLDSVSLDLHIEPDK